jgi:hypothetical protein
MPNGIKLERQRKASHEPCELTTTARPPGGATPRRHTDRAQRATDKRVANGFKLKPGQPAGSGDADSPPPVTSGQQPAGEPDMSAQPARHQTERDGGRACTDGRDGPAASSSPTKWARDEAPDCTLELLGSNGGGEQQQPPIEHDTHRLNASIGSCNIMNTAAPNNGSANNAAASATAHNDKSNNLACYLTLQSGSSCATDAECLAVSASASSNTSSSSTTMDQTVQQQQQQQHNNHQQQQQQQQQQQRQRQQLLVETSATSATKAISTTTRELPLDEDDRANLVCDDAERLKNYQMAPMRSASTGCALELYVINNNETGSHSRLTVSGGARGPPGQLLAGDPHLGPGTALIRKDMTTNRSGSSTLQVKSSLQEDCHGGTLTQAGVRTAAAGVGAPRLDHANRPRSIGSGSFAPFQVVRFQATHRQLSQNETTTRLLIAVIILFLICEFPAGILAALCAILGQDFFDNVYQPMGLLTDLLALINSSVNFILYCFMSTQFRVTFYRVVLHCPAPRETNPLK